MKQTEKASASLGPVFLWKALLGYKAINEKRGDLRHLYGSKSRIFNIARVSLYEHFECMDYNVLRLVVTYGINPLTYNVKMSYFHLLAWGNIEPSSQQMNVLGHESRQNLQWMEMENHHVQYFLLK